MLTFAFFLSPGLYLGEPRGLELQSGAVVYPLLCWVVYARLQ